jgi:hypothetical protein
MTLSDELIFGSSGMAILYVLTLKIGRSDS